MQSEDRYIEFDLESFEIKNGREEDVTSYRAFRRIYPNEYDRKVFDFVFNPSAEVARQFPIQSDLGSGFRSAFTSERYPGKRLKMSVVVFLLDENGNRGKKVSSDFRMDFSGETRKSLLEAFEVSEANRQIAEESATGYMSKQGSETAKSLPLPKLFSMPQGPAYSATSNAQILQMIKSIYGVNQIWSFRFYKNDAPVEYEVYKNDLGIPTKMFGYRIFYFIYRNPADQACKVGGGHLERDYVGGGKFAPPKIIWTNAILENGENYPVDADDRIIVDCAKVK